MNYAFHVFLIASYALAISALPVIEIRTADTDGGPITHFKLLALPILREIALPDTTLYYMTSNGCSPPVHQPGETTPEATQPDNAKKPEENTKANEIPSVTFLV